MWEGGGERSATAARRESVREEEIKKSKEIMAVRGAPAHPTHKSPPVRPQTRRRKRNAGGDVGGTRKGREWCQNKQQHMQRRGGGCGALTARVYHQGGTPTASAGCRARSTAAQGSSRQNRRQNMAGHAGVHGSAGGGGTGDGRDAAVPAAR